MALSASVLARAGRRLCLAAALAAASPGAAAAAVSTGAVAALLSAQTGPYEQAAAGWREELGADAPVLALTREEPRLPEGLRVLVLFGAKAALRRAPPGVAVVYAMAPGTSIPERARAGSAVVSMIPSPEVLLAKLGELQPGLRRLGVLWQSEDCRPYVERLREAAAAAGVEVSAQPVGPRQSVQDRLRGLYAAKPDAVWLMPDPLLISAGNLISFKDFSWENGIPLYAPTAGLVGHGPLASVGVSFRDIGREAARSARRALSEASVAGRDVYPERVEIAVDAAAARRLGRTVPEAVLRAADKVLP